jgi:UPF0755 protein
MFSFFEQAYRVASLAFLRRKKVALIVMSVSFFVFVALFLVFPPSTFNNNSHFVFPEEASAQTIASSLKEAGYIRSATLFLLFARLSGTDTSLKSGLYSFENPQTLITILHRLAQGDTGSALIRATLTEGMTSYEMRDYLATLLPAFDGEKFYEEAKLLEGYLAPDTYFFGAHDTHTDVLEVLTKEFEATMNDFAPEIEASGTSVEDLVTLASILEKEGRTLEERRHIASVLYNRLSIGMGLQVDATFGYIQKRETFHPSFKDLEVDSLYNTYKYVGLPPGPICNPSKESLLAAMTPIESKDLYYLTGTNGVTHFAKTFDEHKRNRALYLQ